MIFLDVQGEERLRAFFDRIGDPAQRHDPLDGLPSKIVLVAITNSVRDKLDRTNKHHPFVEVDLTCPEDFGPAEA